MKICVLLISLFGLSSLYTALTCQENDNARDAEKFKQDVNPLHLSAWKSIDGLKDDESDDVMQSKDDMRNIEARPCSCDSRQCLCCGFRQYKYLFWRIPVKACYRLIPIPRHYAAVLTYILNGHVEYHALINMSKPPHRVCKHLPKFPKVFTRSNMCLVFNKVDAARRIVCAYVTGWIKVPFKTYHFYATYGCVKLPTVGNSDQQYLDSNPEFEDLKFTRPSSSDLEDVKRSDEGENDVNNDIEDADDLEIPRTGQYDLDEIELPNETVNDLDDLEMLDEGHNGPGGDKKNADDFEMARDDKLDGEDNHGGDDVVDGKNDDDFFFFEEV